MKKNLIRIIVLGVRLAVICAFVPGAKAQTPAGGSPSAAAQKLAMIAKQLNLTPEQKAKLAPILEAEAPKIKALKENASLSSMQKLDQLRAIHQQTDPQVKSILTAQQYMQWEEMRRQEVRKLLQQKSAVH
jgi:protein CpxP